MTYRPALLGKLSLHYANSRLDWDDWRDLNLLIELGEDAGADPWEGARNVKPPKLVKRPITGAAYQPLPALALKDKSYATWAKSLKGHAYKNCRVQALKCSEPKLISRPGESAREFAARVAQARREERDRAVAKLHDSYKTKARRLLDKIDRAEERLADEKGEYSAKKVDSFITVGSAILETILGSRKVTQSKIGKARTAARSVGRTKRQREDIAKANKALKKAQADLAELRSDHGVKLALLKGKYDPAAVKLTQVEIVPRKTDIAVKELCLVWLPV